MARLVGAPRRVLREPHLRRVGQRPGDDLPAARVGDGDRAVRAHQAPPPAGLVQLVRQLVEMRAPAQDQPLPRLLAGLQSDRTAPEAGLVGQGVGEPRLAPGQPPDLLERVLLERPPRLRRIVLSAVATHRGRGRLAAYDGTA